ncbi:radical SAM protein [bacterium]|uniref:Uncharacterized protein n=3 Tax=Candidatus Nealsoniibacteriota TaxID=1817911 RepID=A0A2H9N142_9BACT|nr:radical SAM protein [bacterium]PIW91268.1 MAG: hypothetical protein COZ90_01305 [Candidatus Nealsonbacteria bacterium CG_4_8_14_3_um_filter_37_36]
MKDTWGFVIDITYKCFHRCRHCCVKSSPDGPSMPWERIKDLLGQINAWGRPYGLDLTGGDIFRYADQGKCLGDILGEAMSLPGAKEYWRGLKLAFAPFGPKDYSSPTPIEILEFLASLIDLGFCRLTTSYALYSEDNIDKRLSYTLSQLFKFAGQIAIVVTIDRNNDHETGRRLRQTLKRAGFLPDQDFRSLAQIGIFGPDLHFLNDDIKIIEIAVNPTLAAGRAKSWEHLYKWSGKDECPRKKPEQKETPREKEAPSKLAYITLKGNVLPCYSTFPELSPLGNVWQESLVKVLSRWDDYTEQLERHFQLNYSPRVGIDLCTWCAKTFQFKP